MFVQESLLAPFREEGFGVSLQANDRAVRYLARRLLDGDLGPREKVAKKDVDARAARAAAAENAKEAARLAAAANKADLDQVKSTCHEDLINDDIWELLQSNRQLPSGLDVGFTRETSLAPLLWRGCEVLCLADEFKLLPLLDQQWTSQVSANNDRIGRSLHVPREQRGKFYDKNKHDDNVTVVMIASMGIISKQAVSGRVRGTAWTRRKTVHSVTRTAGETGTEVEVGAPLSIRLLQISGHIVTVTDSRGGIRGAACGAVSVRQLAIMK